MIYKAFPNAEVMSIAFSANLTEITPLFPNLKKLHLECNTSMEFHDIKMNLDHCPSLESLSSYKVFDMDLKCDEQLAKIQKLVIRYSLFESHIG